MILGVGVSKCCPDALLAKTMKMAMQRQRVFQLLGCLVVNRQAFKHALFCCGFSKYVNFKQIYILNIISKEFSFKLMI